jgi:hypothetical protein
MSACDPSDEVTDINDTPIINYNIYPNPASSEIFISKAINIEHASVKIFDLLQNEIHL